MLRISSLPNLYCLIIVMQRAGAQKRQLLFLIACTSCTNAFGPTLPFNLGVAAMHQRSLQRGAVVGAARGPQPRTADLPYPKPDAVIAPPRKPLTRSSLA